MFFWGEVSALAEDLKLEKRNSFLFSVWFPTSMSRVPHANKSARKVPTFLDKLAVFVCISSRVQVYDTVGLCMAIRYLYLG